MNGLDFGTAIGLIKGLGSPDPAVIEGAVNDWLDDHPEATTTVQDGSITKAKLDSDLQGAVDDVADLKSHIDDINDEIYTPETVTYNQSTNPLEEIAGTIDSEGNVITVLAHYAHTELVGVKPGSIVVYTSAWAYASYCVVACYDKNQNFLASASKIATTSGEQSGSHVLNDNVYYISLMIRDTGYVYTLQVTKSKSVLENIDASINAINGDIETINTDIETIESELVVIRNVTHNKSVNALSFTLGSITNTGDINTALSNYYYSEKVAVVPGTVISYKNLIAFNGWCRIAAYDASEAFLAAKSLLAESTGFDTGTWTVPDGVAYASFEAFNPVNNTTDPYEVTVPVQKPITEILDSVGSVWAEKTAVIIGDSITGGLYTPTGGTEGPDEIADPIFWQTAGEILGIGTFVGYGISGTSISRTSGTLPSYAMSIRYVDMIDGADLVIVAGGTNDYGTNVVLGTIADTTDISFYGALHVLCDGLQSKYLGKRIVFITPIHRANEEANTAGYTLEQYRQAIYDVARDVYGFAVIDGKEMAISCANASFKNLYIYDGLHPTQEGHNVYGQALGHKLLSI